MDENQKEDVVTVIWLGGCKKEFNATEVSFGGDSLCVKLENGENRKIPLRQVSRVILNYRKPSEPMFLTARLVYN